MKVQSVILLVVVALVASGNGAESPRVLCGRNLAEARLLYCFSTEEGNLQKRSIPDGATPNAIGGALAGASSENKELWNWPKTHALGLGSRAKRIPGLVDECCYKACYVSELLNYC